MVEKSGKKSLVDWGKKLRGDWAVTEKEAGRENGRICRLAEKSRRDV